MEINLRMKEAGIMVFVNMEMPEEMVSFVMKPSKEERT